jgi:hypothetical protein
MIDQFYGNASLFKFFQVFSAGSTWVCRESELANLVAANKIESACILAVSTTDQMPSVDLGTSSLDFQHEESVFHQNKKTKCNKVGPGEHATPMKSLA